MTAPSRPVAVITGASSGIGEEFARRYAREGFDLVLVARTETKLRQLATHLSDQHGVAVDIHVADLVAPADTEALAHKIEHELPRLDHVINCAGVAMEGDLNRADPRQVRAMLPGRAARLPVAGFRDFLAQDSQLHAVLHRYTQTVIVQLSQNVACNLVHVVEQRAARWLLTTGDRMRGHRFPLTQDFLARMLGVRRSTVSEVAGKLQTGGLITYHRGELEILARDRLEDTACECYRIIKDEFDSLVD